MVPQQESFQSKKETAQTAVLAIQAQLPPQARLTPAEMKDVVGSSVFLARDKARVLERVTDNFIHKLEEKAKAGNAAAGEFAERLTHLKEDKQGNKPTEIAQYEIPAQKAKLEQKAQLSAPRGLTTQAEESIKSIATSFGVDPNYVLQLVRTTPVTASGRPGEYTSINLQGPYIDPHDPQQHLKSVGYELASSILSAAYGFGKPWEQHPAKPDFSEASLSTGVSSFTSSQSPLKLKDETTRKFVAGEAKKLGVNSEELGSALMTYTSLKMSGKSQMAEDYLKGMDFNPKAAEFVRVASARTNASQEGDNNMQFYITPKDTLAIRSEEARSDRLRKIV